ncbi:MAG TPA: hypothetical protein DCL21_03510 [Alphaproteobacteria bacterium]|nr:hypothetical protein [Alphaproteobacteria bacterium]
MDNKKVLYGAIGGFILVMFLAIVFVMSKTKGKELMLTINKLYFAYSSYIVDLGTAPETVSDLYQNTKNIAKWNGPYISKATLENYSDGNIEITEATSIPTKSCPLDYISNCYKWIKITNLSSADFGKIKSEANYKTEMFFAENNLFFRLSIVE